MKQERLNRLRVGREGREVLGKKKLTVKSLGFTI